MEKRDLYRHNEKDPAPIKVPGPLAFCMSYLTIVILVVAIAPSTCALMK